MGRIVEITAEYRRTIQPAEYQSRSAGAVIKWAADEDEVADLETELAASFDVAVAHVHERLELETPKAAPKKARGTSAKAAAEKKAPAKSSAADLDDDDEGRAISDSPEDRKPAEKKKSTARSGKKAAASTKASKSAASLDDDDEPELPDHLNKAKQKAKELEGDTGDDDITNDDLNKACKARREKLVEAGVEDAGKLIMQCISDFGPGDGKPFQLKDIPQKSRAKFLSKLELIGGTDDGDEDWMKD